MSGGTQSASVTAANASSTGIKNRLQYLEEERGEIMSRLDDMRQKCEEQKERMEDAIRVITVLKAKVSRQMSTIPPCH